MAGSSGTENPPQRRAESSGGEQQQGPAERRWKWLVARWKWLGAAIAAVAILLGNVETIISSASSTKDRIESRWKGEEKELEAEYSLLTRLSPGGPVEGLERDLGVPDIRRPYESNPTLQERVWVRRIGGKPMGQVITRSDAQGTVQLLAITSNDDKYTPAFKVPALGDNTVTLRRTPVAEVTKGPDVVDGMRPGRIGQDNGQYYFEGTLPLGVTSFYFYVWGASDAPSHLNGDSLDFLDRIGLFNDHVSGDEINRFLSRPDVQAMRDRSKVDTFAQLVQWKAPKDVGAPWVEPGALAPHTRTIGG